MIVCMCENVVHFKVYRITPCTLRLLKLDGEKSYVCSIIVFIFIDIQITCGRCCTANKEFTVSEICVNEAFLSVLCHSGCMADHFWHICSSGSQPGEGVPEVVRGSPGINMVIF